MSSFSIFVTGFSWNSGSPGKDIHHLAFMTQINREPLPPPPPPLKKGNYLSGWGQGGGEWGVEGLILRLEFLGRGRGWGGVPML